MDGKHWAKVSKRGITESKIKNPHPLRLHININLHIQFQENPSKRSRKSSDYELFLMKASKERNPSIRGQIKKR